VIAICSAASGEGNTSVATSLTVSFAGASKKRTLLIDADLRSPEAAAVLGVANRPGLAELLAGKNSLEEVIQRVGATNAYVLPAGRCKGSPHHLVQPSVVNRLLNGLKEKFTTIIIDTPPVLSASESLVYAKAADLVVYCTLRDVSQASQLRSAVSRLHDAGVVFAGAVLSGVPCSTYAQHYGVYGNLHSVSNDAPLAQI
jgi:polysaccharide biosynthesis transport protein